jgi:hypothetical protein
MTKKVKNKNLNMFVRNNGKKDYVHVLYPLLYVAKKDTWGTDNPLNPMMYDKKSEKQKSKHICKK